jgi:uncharacterized protein (TIGR02246 family)
VHKCWREKCCAAARFAIATVHSQETKPRTGDSIMKRILLGSIVLSACVFGRLPADEPAAQPSPDETAIRKMVAGYVEAFNKHDAVAVAGLWSPEAVYLNRATGENIVGRPDIAKHLTDLFKDQPELKMTVNTESIRLVSPNVAVEQGISTETAGKGEPEEVPYTAVYVKRDGQWLLDRVTDKQTKASSSHYEHLQELEWMVGTWVDRDEGDDVTIQTECNWTKNRTFLTRMYSVSIDGEEGMAGMQVVGWDPAAKTIRSWTFDSDGGFSEGTWDHKGDRWIISNKGVLGDGRKASAVNVVKKINDSSFTWQTTDRTAGGDVLPNVDEVLIVRK